jgi:pimeloyl-ACP methyl ester carboxylesterase
MIEKSMVSDIQTRPSREWLTRKIGELFYDPARHLRDADIDRAHQELSKRSGARAMVRLSRSARRDGIEARVCEIAAPTLLIWGRNDVVTPPEAAEQFMSRLQDSRIIWFDECGHTPMIEKPEEFSRALLDFAGELDRRSGGQG